MKHIKTKYLKIIVELEKWMCNIFSKEHSESFNEFRNISKDHKSDFKFVELNSHVNEALSYCSLSFLLRLWPNIEPFRRRQLTQPETIL